MGMALCEVVGGLLEDLPHVFLKVLRGFQGQLGEERPFLVTPVCVFTVPEPRATTPHPSSRSGAYAQHGLCFSRKHTTLWIQLAAVLWYYVLLAD